MNEIIRAKYLPLCSKLVGKRENERVCRYVAVYVRGEHVYFYFFLE